MEPQVQTAEQETKKIIATYQKVYDLIFTYSIFVVMIVLSFIAALLLKPSSFASTTNEISILSIQKPFTPTLLQSGDAYIAKGIMLNPQIDNIPFSLSILQGFISVSPEAQMGYGALGYHSGIMLPLSINLINHENSNYTREFFATESYPAEELDNFIKDTILTYPVKNIQTSLYQYKPGDIGLTDASIPKNVNMSTENSLSDLFGLKCLTSWHLTNYFCYKNTEHFVSRIPYMAFDKNLSELSSLVGDILKTPYKKSFCDNLLYTFSRSATSAREWELMFSECGDTYTQAYHRITDFATATYELQGISNTKLYADDDINIFKLLSLQQKIYQNTLQKNYDISTIDVYLSFVQDLLTKRPNIEQIYKDIVYVYNNKYLQSILTQIAIRNNNTKAMLRLTDVIKSINDGSIHLKRMINNTGLIAYIESAKGETVSQPNLVTFQDLFASKFTTFENFIVTNQKVDNASLEAEIEGYFVVNTDGRERKVLFIGNYIFSNDSFILTSASFPQNTYLEVALNKLIREQQARSIDIPFVYEYIRNNSSDSQVVQTVSICDLISARIAWTECNTTSALFEEDTYRVVFMFEGYKIASISTQEDKLTDTLTSTLNGKITTQENIGTVIRDLIKLASNYNSGQQPTDVATGVDTNQFTIISKFRQFFGIAPESITLNSGKYLTEFKLGDMHIITAIDVQSNYKMFPIGIKRGGQVIRINNFSLNLTNASLTDINQFKASPWEYVKKLDPAAYELAYPKAAGQQ